MIPDPSLIRMDGWISRPDSYSIEELFPIPSSRREEPWSVRARVDLTLPQDGRVAFVVIVSAGLRPGAFWSLSFDEGGNIHSMISCDVSMDEMKLVDLDAWQLSDRGLSFATAVGAWLPLLIKAAGDARPAGWR